MSSDTYETPLGRKVASRAVNAQKFGPHFEGSCAIRLLLSASPLFGRLATLGRNASY